MLGLDNLKTRLNYYGGKNQEKRMIKDKERSLKKALLYSYQSVTIALMDENGDFTKKFRALINPDKNKGDYDDKILSVPYSDICLNDEIAAGGTTTQGLVPLNIKVGDVFEWVETGTKWLIYLQYLEEDAYFRAEIRRCDQQTEVNGKKYWTYIRGPMETSITWNQKGGVEWNDLNYSLVMYITKDENTTNYFHRFQKVKIGEPGTDIQKTWQTVAVNPYYGDGIIEVYLDEYYENSIEDAANASQGETSPDEPQDPTDTYIDGPAALQPYDEQVYTIMNDDGQGIWSIVYEDETYYVEDAEKQENFGAWIEIPKRKKLLILQENDMAVRVILNVSAGSFSIVYSKDGQTIAEKTVNIES